MVSNCSKLSDIAGALSMEVHNGITSPFEEDLHTIRPQSGQLATARNIRNLLEGSKNTTVATQQGTDPYTLHIPQIHGASKDSIAYVKEKLKSKSTLSQITQSLPKKDTSSQEVRQTNGATI